MVRIAVGKCSHCGNDLRVKAEAVKSEMRFTCKCGAINTVYPSTSVLEESSAIAASPDNEILTLIKRLDSRDPTVANPDSEPAQRLCEFGSLAVPHLTAVMKGERKADRSRWIAATILGRISDTASIEALLEVAGNDKENERIRGDAAQALAESTADPNVTVPILIQALNDTRPHVRYSAAAALAKLGNSAKVAVPALVRVLDDSDERLAKAVAGALARIDPVSRAAHHEKVEKTRARDMLDDKIRELKDANPAVRVAASREMCELPDIGDFYFRAVEPLITALHDDEVEVRANAAYTLAKIRDKRATDALIRCLQDPDPAIGHSVRQYAAFALGQIGDPKATMPLIYTLGTEKDWSARIEMIKALGSIGDSAAIACLRKIQETDGDPEIQSEASDQIERIEKNNH
ncbi:HEAT repeat domain-containing protein [Chloroflexota bacterium]